MLKAIHTDPTLHSAGWCEELTGSTESNDEDELPYWPTTAVNPEQPVVNDQLTTAQRQELDRLLQRFEAVLSHTPGTTDMVEHRILMLGRQPVRLPPYRIPHAYRARMQREIEDMLKSGVIEPSNSEWSFPLVVVPKKDGSLRICVGYRKLNSLSQADAYPMPRIDDLIDRLGNARFITTLDLTKGYWQVPVARECRHLTAFITDGGLYQFVKMPFGLQGAPATFQRLMDRVLSGHQEFAAAYLDDVVIHSSTWSDHLRHLDAVLSRLSEAGLTANPKKCRLAMTQCSYLGHTVGSGVVRPEVAKTQAIKDFAIPVTKTDVRAFLGLAGYYRRFIPDFATLAAPLSDLTRKLAPARVSWSPECGETFKALKKSLGTSPLLRNPDFSRPFVLQTDASERGLGAVLSQRDAEDHIHPVAYFSKKLQPREEKYSTVEKEYLAVRQGMLAFSLYLLGRAFVVETDQRSLMWLNKA